MAAPYLRPRHLFIAFSKMLATQERSPRVRDYHAMKYRLLTGLFDANVDTVNMQRLPHLAEGDPTDFACRSVEELYDLAQCYSQEAYYHPSCWGDQLKSWLMHLPGTRESLRQIRRLAARKRQIYVSMAIKILELLHPGIDRLRVHVGRLAELGFPAKPPKNGWEYRIRDDEDDEGSRKSDRGTFNDDLSPEMLRLLKKQEEDRRRTHV